jgi:glycosyltransferase involved in cell wall biosynthesis
MSDRHLKRILMTTDTVGGVWTFTLELARQLSKSGIQVVMATLGGLPNPGQTAEAESIPDLCLLSSDFKLEWMENPWDDVDESGRWLLRLEQEYRPDLVHLNSFGHGNLNWSCPVMLTAHSCVLSWWAAVRNEPAPPTWNRYKATVARALQAADVVTCPTTAMASELINYGDFAHSRAVVIPNGRDRTQFYRGPKEPFVITAGRLWDEAKNTAAVAKVAGTLPWPVYAAGGNNSPRGESLHFPGVHLLGHLPTAELAHWLARASIFALPARYDPFGLAAVEAGLSGCALVLGDIPSQHEVWGDAALFVSPDDNVALQSSIRSLIDKPNLLAEMSERSCRRALTFDPAQTAALYLEAYRSALSGSVSRALSCAS